MRQYIGKMKSPAILVVMAFVLAAFVACADDQPSTAAPAQPIAAPTQAAAAAPAAPAPAAPAAPTPAPAAPATSAPAPAAPAPTAPAQQMAEPIRVVTTSNIVADWVRNVGGERVDVSALLSVAQDPHTYQPSPRDVATIADADLVLSVGLLLEHGWLDELLHNAARDESSIVALAELVDPIEFVEIHGVHDDHDDHAGEEKILEEIAHVLEEVEHGHFSAEQALAELEEVIEAVEGMEHDEHDEDEHDEDEHDEDEHDEDEHDEDEHDEDEHDEDEHDEDEDDHEEHGHDEHGHEEGHLPDMVLAIIAEVEEGHLDAEEAIEEIEHLIHEGEGAHEDHDEDEDEDAHAGHGHGAYDPHFWFDPHRVKVAVNDIAARLSALDPEGTDTYMANAAAYGAELDQLHEWIKVHVQNVPSDRRLLVTSHDAFGYFAEEYDFEVVGVILPGGGTEIEPSAADIAELGHEIEEYGVPAMFGETTVSERLAASIADDAGIELVRLYSGSLGEEGSGAGTYIGMFRTNVERIVDALK